MTRLFPRPLPTLLALLVLGTTAQETLAACTDAAMPGVQWRRCFLDGSDLTGADLSGADLRDSSLKRSDLSGARLTEIQARRAKFVSSVLTGADFAGADLTQADLTSADLRDVSFVRASLRGARLYDSNLRGANLTEAVLDGTDLLRANLSGATWTDGKTICAEGSIGRCHPSNGAGASGSRVQG